MSDPTSTTDRPPSTNGHAPAVPPPVPDLPPVEAPSAGFIVQLFVIPAVVVFVVILVWLLFGKLAGGERDAMEYVRLIRASDANWRSANRAAYELASLIQNDSRLAEDPRLLGELAEVLQRDLDRPENVEMAQYLALALGRFSTLEGSASSGQKIDALAVLTRALDPKYSDGVRIAAAASIAKHAARLEGNLADAGAVAALAQAATHGEPAVKQTAVFALGFLGGDDAARALRDRLQDGDRYVRYNAAAALTRRDDPAALGTAREMLTPADLEKVITLETPEESRAKIEEIELEALTAVQKAVDQKKTTLALQLRPALEGLTRSGLAGVRNNAQAILKSLPSVP